MTSEKKFVTEAVKRVLLREYMQSKTKRAGFGGLDIQRTPMGTRVTLITERPGMVIGRRGRTIDELTLAIAKDFKFDNPQIEVQEVSNPNLNAMIMAHKLAEALERGWHFRRAGHSTVRRIMDAGAKGCLIIISGKLTGERHRTEKFIQGHIKHCGEPAEEFMLKGFAAAKKKPGIIGVQVQIMVPEARLPDEINIIPVGIEEIVTGDKIEESEKKEDKDKIEDGKDKSDGIDEEEKKDEVVTKKKSLKKQEFDEVTKIVEEEKAKLEKKTEEIKVSTENLSETADTQVEEEKPKLEKKKAEIEVSTEDLSETVDTQVEEEKAKLEKKTEEIEVSTEDLSETADTQSEEKGEK